MPQEEWPEEEKLRHEKETLGFYVSGHPLNRYAEEIRLFATSGVTTETLSGRVDEIVNIAGIVSQIKRTKIKKGPNEGKLMAKFILDDQYGSVEVVVFSDLFSKYARWLDNGLAVLLTASVKDTGGMSGNRSASLQSAEQAAQHIDDEYGGHPEARGRVSAYFVRGPRFSYYEVGEDDAEDDRDPKEIEIEKYGDRKDNLSLFGGGPPASTTESSPPEPARAPSPPGAPSSAAAQSTAIPVPPLPPGEVASTSSRRDDVEAGEGRASDPDEVEDDLADEEPQQPVAALANGDDSESFAARAAEFHDSPVTPELNALEIIQLDGIRDRKVKEISLEIPYPRMNEDTVRKIREIVEEHIGEIPLSVTLVDLPAALAENGELRLKISHHFRVAPGPSLNAALQQVHASARYVF